MNSSSSIDHKLVRDGIPELIESEGRVANVRVASSEEYCRLLREKLVEEVDEFLESGESEELADILEVVYALAKSDGIDVAELEEKRIAKAVARGGFTQRLVLVMNHR